MLKNCITRTRTDRFFSVEVPGKEIIAALNQELKVQGQRCIPLDATIVVSVPGGGDWSNTELDLNEQPVNIRWTEIEEA